MAKRFIDPIEAGPVKSWSSIPTETGRTRADLKRGATQAAKQGGLKKITGNPTVKTTSTTKRGGKNTVSHVITKGKTTSRAKKK